MEDNRELFDELNGSSDLFKGLSAGADVLVVVGTIQDGKVETIALSCTAANWFRVGVRELDSPAGTAIDTLLGPLRHNGDGLLYIEENFKDPIFSYGANKEVVIQNIELIDSDVEIAASMKVWERRA
ncbi:unnamed protein product [marine sediment metagenome]|uniref:Uncharacterized protein n=1 Tax=marine sediment metagenome TaxID=412755 RepID=X1MN12_9ZZZZ